MTLCTPEKAAPPDLKRDAKKYRKHLVDLTAAVKYALSALDNIMKGPSTSDRGKRVAAVCNALEMTNDRARYFGLDVDWRKDKKPRADGEEQKR